MTPAEREREKLVLVCNYVCTLVGVACSIMFGSHLTSPQRNATDSAATQRAAIIAAQQRSAAKKHTTQNKTK
jgi:hypothetical protein